MKIFSVSLRGLKKNTEEFTSKKSQTRDDKLFYFIIVFNYMFILFTFQIMQHTYYCCYVFIQKGILIPQYLLSHNIWQLCTS